MRVHGGISYGKSLPCLPSVVGDARIYSDVASCANKTKNAIPFPVVKLASKPIHDVLYRKHVNMQKQKAPCLLFQVDLK